MGSRTELCNRALARIGVPPLTGPEDRRREAEYCARFFDGCRDELLCLSAFRCAFRRAALAREPEGPAFGYRYRYALPADFLYLAAAGDSLPPFSIEGGELLTDAERFEILYIARIRPEEMPPYLDSCFELLLGSRLAAVLANDSGLASNLLAELNQVALPRARACDARQTRPGTGAKLWESIV